MSFLTALFDAYGGYGAGKQQRFTDTLAQQQQATQGRYADIASREAQVKEATYREAAKQILANQGTNPATAAWNPQTLQWEGGKPFVPPLPISRELGHGGQPWMTTDPNTGKPVKSFTPPPDVMLQHLYNYADWLTRTGQTDLANSVLGRANALQTEQLRQMTADQTTQRDLMMFGLRDDATQRNQLRAEDYGTNKMLAGEAFQSNLMGQREDFSAWQNRVNDLKTTAHTSQRNVETATTANTADMGKLFGENTAASQGHTTKDASGSVVPLNQVNPNMKDFSKNINIIVQTLITGKRDGKPISPTDYANQQIDQISKQPYLSDHQRGVAIGIIQRTANAVREAQESNQALQDAYGQRPKINTATGGSNAAGNPTRSGTKLSQRSIWQMAVENGATPQEATRLAAIAYAESGGDPGSVNPTDNGGKQTSWGLFQISDGTHNEPAGWNDPQRNVQMALAKLRSQGWGAWGTYNTRKYQQFLPRGSA